MPIYENTTTLVRRTVLRTHEIEPGLLAFKRQTTHTRSKDEGTLTMPPERRVPDEVQGIIDADNLAKLLAGKSYTTRSDLSLVLPEVREIMRTLGYAWTLSDKVRERFEALTPKGVYDAFADGRATADDLVWLKHDSHMLCDRNGQVLPVAILFSYIDGRIDNRTYDLKTAAAHLLTRDDVTLFPVKDWREEPDLDGVAKTVEEAIAPVPHYNRDGGRTHTITFRWSPSVEDYRKMWAECERIGGKYPSTEKYRAVFNLDLLGLRACGAARCDDYYQDVRPERNDDDEDY